MKLGKANHDTIYCVNDKCSNKKNCERHKERWNFDKDKRIVNYIPKIGQRVFIDMPFDYYKIYCRVRAKMIKENVEGNTDTLQKIYNNLITEYNKKEPYIIKI